MKKAELVEAVPGGIRRVAPEAPEAVREASGVRVQASDSSFQLVREYPHSRPVYYRVDYGRLEWGFDLDGFLPAAGRPESSPEALLALLPGTAPAPDSTLLPGVRQLPVGTAVRVTEQGITVIRRQPDLPAHDPRQGLAETVSEALGGLACPIAYSGGLGSAFLAACALSAGHRPLLLHADLGPGVHRGPVPEIPPLTLKRIRVDPSELLDEHPITGEEVVPPMPDSEVPRRLAAALARAEGAGEDLPLTGGTLVKELTSVKLPDVNAGVRGWRLLAAEPFHISGTLRTLDQARALIGKGKVYSPDAQPVDGPAPPSPTGGSGVPGLTPEGEELFGTAHRAAMGVWQEHLDFLHPLLGKLTAGVGERGDGGMRLPALDPRVLAAVSALGPSRLGRIRRGVFENHLPVHRELARHRITGIRRTAPAFWLRRAAAAHLYRERRKITARLDRACVLADLGLIDRRAVLRVLGDGRELADHAMPLLRLVWLERWLRGRS